MMQQKTVQNNQKQIPESVLYCNIFGPCICAGNITHWSVYQDLALLKQFLLQSGTRQWVKISKIVHRRSSDGVRNRCTKILQFLNSSPNYCQYSQLHRIKLYIERVQQILMKRKQECKRRKNQLLKQLQRKRKIIEQLRQLKKRLKTQQLSYTQLLRILKKCKNQQQAKDMENNQKQIQTQNYKIEDTKMRKYKQEQISSITTSYNNRDRLNHNQTYADDTLIAEDQNYNQQYFDQSNMGQFVNSHPLGTFQQVQSNLQQYGTNYQTQQYRTNNQSQCPQQYTNQLIYEPKNYHIKSFLQKNYLFNCYYQPQQQQYDKYLQLYRTENNNNAYNQCNRDDNKQHKQQDQYQDKNQTINFYYGQNQQQNQIAPTHLVKQQQVNYYDYAFHEFNIQHAPMPNTYQINNMNNVNSNIINMNDSYSNLIHSFNNTIQQNNYNNIQQNRCNYADVGNNYQNSDYYNRNDYNINPYYDQTHNYHTNKPAYTSNNINGECSINNSQSRKHGDNESQLNKIIRKQLLKQMLKQKLANKMKHIQEISSNNNNKNNNGSNGNERNNSQINTLQDKQYRKVNKQIEQEKNKPQNISKHKGMIQSKINMKKQKQTSNANASDNDNDNDNGNEYLSNKQEQLKKIKQQRKKKIGIKKHKSRIKVKEEQQNNLDIYQEEEQQKQHNNKQQQQQSQWQQYKQKQSSPQQKKKQRQNYEGSQSLLKDMPSFQQFVVEYQRLQQLGIAYKLYNLTWQQICRHTV